MILLHFAAATSFYGSISETFTFFEFSYPPLKVLQTAAKVGLFSISLLLINFPRQVNLCQLKERVAAWHRGSIGASYPAVSGLNLTLPVIFLMNFLASDLRNIGPA